MLSCVLASTALPHTMRSPLGSSTGTSVDNPSLRGLNIDGRTTAPSDRLPTAYTAQKRAVWVSNLQPVDEDTEASGMR